MTEALTAFDAVAITLVILSALMALARGFVRELATLGAFICALAAAYLARSVLRDPVSALFSEGSADWLPDVTIMVIVFIAVYALVAWLGQRLSRTIQGVEGIGLIDRLSGLIFGIARGGVAVVFFVYLVQLGMDQDRIPTWIADARTYPFFASAADYVNENAPRIAEDMREALPETPEPDNS
ncbi:MAG: CvpA family protein [Pseudomonadota bacterium]